VLSLEEQVDSLKADLTEVRRSQSLSSADRDSLSAFDQTEVKSRAADAPEIYHDPRYSFSFVYKRNKTRDWVPIPSMENTADDRTSHGTNAQSDSATRSVFKSPERCIHSCSIAASKGKPADHCIHVHTTNGVSVIGSSEDTTACNGETVSENGDQLSSDVDILNDTLSDLVESNSDTSGRVFDVKVLATVRCKNHVEALKSDALNRSNGSASASETWKLSTTSSSSETQTDAAGHCNDCAAQTEHDNDRYVITTGNHFSRRYY